VSAGPNKTVAWPPKSQQSGGSGGIEAWTVTQVADWLDTIDMQEFRNGFVADKVDGRQLVGLREADMARIGLTTPIQRMKLEREIRKLHKAN
jgi:hypothetical protein